MHTQSRRHRRGSKLSFALPLGMLCVGLCGASLAWACAPYEYGWDAPKAPPSETPSSSQGGSTQSPASAGGSGPQATQPPPSSGGPGSGPVSSPNSAPVNSPNGTALRSPGRVQAQSPAGRQAPAQSPAGRQAPAQSPAGRQAPAQSPAGRQAPAQSPNGSVGQARTGAGSATPQSASPADSGRAARTGGKRHASAGGSGRSPAVQSAIDDSWSAYKADPAASLFTPSWGETADTGPGTGFGVGLALFGLGAAALLGGAASAVARRRRSPAASTDRR